MKGPQKIAATLAVLLLVANGFPVTAGKLPEDPALPNIVSVSGETLPRSRFLKQPNIRMRHPKIKCPHLAPT